MNDTSVDCSTGDTLTSTRIFLRTVTWYKILRTGDHSQISMLPKVNSVRIVSGSGSGETCPVRDFATLEPDYEK